MYILIGHIIFLKYFSSFFSIYKFPYFSIDKVHHGLSTFCNIKSVVFQDDFLQFGRSIDYGIFPSVLKLRSIKLIYKFVMSQMTILIIFYHMFLNYSRHIFISIRTIFFIDDQRLLVSFSSIVYIYNFFHKLQFNRMLISTLDSLGISESLFSWLRSYLNK